MLPENQVRAVRAARVEGKEADHAKVVAMVHGGEWRKGTNIQVKLFPEFASERFHRGFSAFNLAPWKFPKSAEGFSGWALGGEERRLGIDENETGYSDHGDFEPSLHRGRHSSRGMPERSVWAMGNDDFQRMDHFARSFNLFLTGLLVFMARPAKTRP